MRTFLSLAVLASLLLAGCGGDGDVASNPPPTSGRSLYAVTTGNELVRLDRQFPGTVVSRTAISGLNPGETILRVDLRPSNGTIYAITSTGRVGTLSTGGAFTNLNTLVPAPIGTNLSFDFNPVPDRLRIFGTDGASYRVNPDDGQLVATDTSLSAAGVTEVAYTDNVAGTPVTTLFGLDSTNNRLVRIGGVNGDPSPNGGAVTEVATLTGADGATIPVGANASFDIAADGTAYVAAGGALWTLNLSSGRLTRLGDLGASNVVGIAAFTD